MVCRAMSGLLPEPLADAAAATYVKMITNDESEIRASRALAPFESHNRVCIQHRFVIYVNVVLGTENANPTKFTRRRAGAPCGVRAACGAAVHTHRHTRHIGNATNCVGRAH